MKFIKQLKIIAERFQKVLNNENYSKTIEIFVKKVENILKTIRKHLKSMERLKMIEKCFVKLKTI